MLFFYARYVPKRTILVMLVKRPCNLFCLFFFLFAFFYPFSAGIVFFPRSQMTVLTQLHCNCVIITQFSPTHKSNALTKRFQALALHICTACLFVSPCFSSEAKLWLWGAWSSKMEGVLFSVWSTESLSFSLVWKGNSERHMETVVWVGRIAAVFKAQLHRASPPEWALTN